MADMRVIKKELIKMIDKVGIQALEAKGYLKRKQGAPESSRKLKDYKIGGAIPKTRKQVVEIIKENQRAGIYKKEKITPKVIAREAKRIAKYAPFVETDFTVKSGYKFNYKEVRMIRDGGFERNKDTRTTREATKLYKKELKSKTVNMYKKLVKIAEEFGVPKEDMNELEKKFKKWQKHPNKNFEAIRNQAEYVKTLVEVTEEGKDVSPDVWNEVFYGKILK